MVQPSNLINNLEQALACQQNGDLKTATTLYLEVLKHYPNHPEALHLLGVIAHQEGDHEKAVHLIRQALEYNPTAAPYHYNLGEAQYAQKYFTAAAKAYSKSLHLEQENAAAWNRLGLIEQNHNFNFEAADHAYANALKQKPDFPQALNNYGLLKLNQQKYSAAEKSFRKALVLHPDYAEATHNLAIVLQHLGEIDKAEKYFKKTLQLNPTLPGAQRQYTKLLQDSCSWFELQAALYLLEKRTTCELVNSQPTEETPFLHLSHSFDMQRNRMVAEIKCQDLMQLTKSKLH